MKRLSPARFFKPVEFDGIKIWIVEIVLVPREIICHLGVKGNSGLLPIMICITGRYPHNLEKVLEQYTKRQTQKLVNETQEILTWLIQKSLKR